MATRRLATLAHVTSIGHALRTEDAVARFTESLEAQHAPANTLRAYGSDLRGFLRTAPPLLAAVGSRDVEAFLASAPSAATRRRRHATLSSFYRWLERHELLDGVSPMGHVEPGKAPERQPRPLAESVVRKVLGKIEPAATRDRALFWLLYETGCRISEALGICVEDVELADGNEQVRVFGKGQRERTIVLAAAPESVRLLRRHVKASSIATGPLFRGDARYGGGMRPMNYTTARHAWLRYCTAAGVEATIHQLRHSRATELVRGGVPLPTVRKLLGHRSIKTTLLYTEVSDQDARRDLAAYERRKRR